MTAYVTIASGDLDAESPIDTDLMTALARNPDAYAEDDAACPIFKGRYKSTTIDESADASVTATGDLTIASISSVAVAAGQTMVIHAVVRLTTDPTTGTASCDDIKIKHNGTTLATRVVGMSGTAQRDVSIMAKTTTVATGTLLVAAGCTLTGGGSSVASADPQVMYQIFNT